MTTKEISVINLGILGALFIIQIAIDAGLIENRLFIRRLTIFGLLWTIVTQTYLVNLP